MGVRIVGPDGEATGYYSKLKKPLSNPRQHKCKFNIRDCKVCFPESETKIGELVEEKFKLEAPDWVEREINVLTVLANFYPQAEKNSSQQKRAIRDFELIDVYWRRRMPAAESPVLEMPADAIRKRLSRIRIDAEQYIMRKPEDPSWGVAVERPPSRLPLDVFVPFDLEEEVQDFIAGFKGGVELMDAYTRKWCVPHYFHMSRSK